MLWMIAALVLCVVCSAFFSASETAFTTANRVKLKLVEGKKKNKAQLALRLADRYDQLLTTILIGNNIVNIAGTAIATLLFVNLVGADLGATLSTVVMTLIILLFGEISPKILARQQAENLAMAVAQPMRVLMTLLRPVSLLFAGWQRLLKRILPPPENDAPIEAEIMTMVDDAREEGDLEDSEGELIRSALEFKDQVALDVMTPRVDVTALEDTATPEEAGQLFMESGYSRLPVYHEDMDHIVGILNEKDFYLAAHEGRTDLRDVMHEPVFAPSSLNIQKLLHLFQTEKTHLIVLLDEFGGTEGIVTMEDVLEELVGEIYDEHDEVSVDLTEGEDGSLTADGGMQLEDLLTHMGIPDIFEADTVGGWVAEMLERIPNVGDRFEWRGIQCEVTAMEKRRVTEVRLSGQYIPEMNETEET